MSASASQELASILGCRFFGSPGACLALWVGFADSQDRQRFAIFTEVESSVFGSTEHHQGTRRDKELSTEGGYLEPSPGFVQLKGSAPVDSHRDKNMTTGPDKVNTGWREAHRARRYAGAVPAGGRKFG